MKGNIPCLFMGMDGLSVVPSCLDLSAIETELINEAGRELILVHLIKEQKENFDYILIDCLLVILAYFKCADGIEQPDYSGASPILGLTWYGEAHAGSKIRKVQQRLNSDLFISEVLITQYDGRKNLNKSVSEIVQEQFQGKVFSTHIRNAVSLAEAPTQRQDTFHYSPKSAGAEDNEKKQLIYGKKE